MPALHLLAALALPAVAVASSGEVTDLPGLVEKPCWRHYSGYLSTGSRGTQLFYWYHEAVSKPDEKPLVLWCAREPPPPPPPQPAWTRPP
jgi:hypothetical protein